MRDALLNELLGLERGLEGSHVDAGIHLEQVDLLESNSAVDFAGAHLKVRETATDDTLLVAIVLRLPHLSFTIRRLLDKVDIVLDVLHVRALAAGYDLTSNLLLSEFSFLLRDSFHFSFLI